MTPSNGCCLNGVQLSSDEVTAMTMLVSKASLPIIKADLRKSHPETSSCLRTEAMARGLGFSTYASLLSAIDAGPVPARVDNDVYCSHLGVSRLGVRDEPGRFLSRAIARGMLHPILDEQVNLTQRGFDSIWIGSRSEMAKPVSERKADLSERREEAYNDSWSADQFELAMIFLTQQEKIKTLNREHGSYRIKHRAEGISRHFGMFTELGDYVSNGMMIAAAYAAGFTVKPIGDASNLSYNAWFNISKRTVQASGGIDARNRWKEQPEIVRSMYSVLPGAIRASSAA